MIYHPKSPFKGQHYRHPVELLDIYPTLLDINDFPFMLGRTCPEGMKCPLLSGQSLAPVLFGSNFTKFPQVFNASALAQVASEPPKMPVLKKRYAVTQATRCAPRHLFADANNPLISEAQKETFLSRMWDSCGPQHRDDEISLMGYSIRTRSYRYTAYLPFDRRVNKVYNLTTEHPFKYVSEELYDHREDHAPAHGLIDREMVNLAYSPKFLSKVQDLRHVLEGFLSKRIHLRGHSKTLPKI
jgi:hypothetical protein